LSNLRSIGVPTAATEFRQIATVAAAVALAAILVGALFGGMFGEHWHAKLMRRALDPEIGPEADARRQAAADLELAERRREEARARATEVGVAPRQIDLSGEERERAAAQADERARR